MKALREASPQARHSFTVADQVHQLVSAAEAEPDRGFMARTMALCSLPRTNPGNRLQYKRVNGPFTLHMIAGGSNKLPFGNFPAPDPGLGLHPKRYAPKPVAGTGTVAGEVHAELGVYSSGGGNVHTKLRNQMRRLFGCTVSMIYKDEHGEQFVSSLIAERGESGGTSPTSPHVG